MIARLLRWGDRHIRHPSDKEGNFGSSLIVHIPHGLIMGIPIIGWPMVHIFLKYQLNQDERHHHDEAWKDIAGAMVGFSISSLVFLGLILSLAL